MNCFVDMNHSEGVVLIRTRLIRHTDPAFSSCIDPGEGKTVSVGVCLNGDRCCEAGRDVYFFVLKWNSA